MAGLPPTMKRVYLRVAGRVYRHGLRYPHRWDVNVKAKHMPSQYVAECLPASRVITRSSSEGCSMDLHRHQHMVPSKLGTYISFPHCPDALATLD